jgi:maleylacetoacetate isomerase
MTVVLYDYPRSSAAYRVRIALNLCGIPYESRLVNLLAGDHKAAENLARNPQGLVPTLLIDGLRLVQSVAIIEYLHETRAAGFLPADAAGRARVRALAYAVAMEIAPVCNLSVRTRAAEISGGRLTAGDWSRPVIEGGLAALETLLADSPSGAFCHGSRPGLADIVLVPQVYNARRASIDVDQWPRIAAIAAAMEALPPVATAHPDRTA